jgi:hypothetical protein
VSTQTKDRPKTVAVEPDARVSDVIAAWPEALPALVNMGFEPLRNPVMRRAMAPLFTLRQAAAFKGMDVEVLLTALRAAVGQAAPAAIPSEPRDEADRDHPPAAADDADHDDVEEEIPELAGDVRVLGLVPCPVRGILVERFDRWVGALTVASGKRIAWWLAGEGTAINDTRRWLADIQAQGAPERLPEVFAGVGTELFCYPEYGAIARGGPYGAFPEIADRRPDLMPLEDPEGVLGLLFAGLFTLVCRPERLPGGRVPTSWQDLADPALKGHVAIPSLHLPIVPDLLAVLHGYLGEAGFQRFAANVAAALHPSQAAPRVGRQDIPGVIILPTLFSHQSEVAGGLEVVPEEGPIAIPAYAVVRADAPDEASDVARFLCSTAFLGPCWEYGQFLPNHAGIEATLPRGKLLSRPWASLAGGDPGAESDRLLAIVEGAIG